MSDYSSRYIYIAIQLVFVIVTILAISIKSKFHLKIADDATVILTLYILSLVAPTAYYIQKLAIIYNFIPAIIIGFVYGIFGFRFVVKRVDDPYKIITVLGGYLVLMIGIGYIYDIILNQMLTWTIFKMDGPIVFAIVLVSSLVFITCNILFSDDSSFVNPRFDYR